MYKTFSLFRLHEKKVKKKKAYSMHIEACVRFITGHVTVRIINLSHFLFKRNYYTLVINDVILINAQIKVSWFKQDFFFNPERETK